MSPKVSLSRPPGQKDSVLKRTLLSSWWLGGGSKGSRGQAPHAVPSDLPTGVRLSYPNRPPLERCGSKPWDQARPHLVLTRPAALGPTGLMEAWGQGNCSGALTAEMTASGSLPQLLTDLSPGSNAGGSIPGALGQAGRCSRPRTPRPRRPEARRPEARVHSPAAVGVEGPAEELHAHDGEGVVEDKQREAQAVGGADSDGGPARSPPDPRSGWGRPAPSQVLRLGSACREGAS